ncbi:MAG TPA: class F sortase [Nocardioides sp.]|uniref:class F sortase n=1 Tax=Nocardioides sp. TaxID=35761 RepID=UPI002C186A0A|nr:class F sortase [Nocardioides sp.]HQR25769.1 class F sortase [Nocardioides sp.]
MRYLTTRTGRAATIAVAALAGALLSALLVGGGQSAGFTAGRPQSAQLPVVAAVAGADQPSPSARRPARPSPAPRLLAIPRLGLRMPVTPRGVDDQGEMALPASARVVGWYRYGPRPLDDAGATVLAGHVDTDEDGAGPLVAIAGLREGDLVTVRAGKLTARYRVTSVTRVSKARIDLATVFSRAGAPRLHLVTCGGAYLPDQGGYQDNVVVAAQRVAPRAGA